MVETKQKKNEKTIHRKGAKDAKKRQKLKGCFTAEGAESAEKKMKTRVAFLQ
jgi:hypothetical protein